MIHVPRPLPEPQAVRDALLKPFRGKNGDPDKTEIQLAREYYAQQPPPPKAFDFSRYKEFPVCQELDALFHGKCAYCESPYRAVDSLDVEHFRPKGRVAESKTHPGYWWLAAMWTNLLPSCPPCNQRRRHVDYKPGMTLEEFERALQKDPKKTSGKANSFPVRHDHWVDDENGDLTTEDPLLINPTLRDPADHLEWVFDWNDHDYLWHADPVIAAVAPRQVNGEDDPYGKTSIAVYGLNRAGLVRERMERIKDLQPLCRTVVATLDNLARAQTAEEQTRFRAQLVAQKKDLKGYTQENQRYAGMVRAFLVEFETELARIQ